MREAPAITIVENLLAQGATVRAHDPEALTEAKKQFGDRITYSTNQYDILADADVLVIITDWNEYRNPDFDRIKAELKEPFIIDGRNLYKLSRMRDYGFRYLPLGRNSIATEGK
jgi:UDPglucose 6-dehydrogenase